MSRAQLRRPWVLALAGRGWALLVLVWIPALIDALPWRVQLVPEPPACGWVISTAGRIHGPDSPYRGLVNATRCYPTRAAAEAALQSE
jgi:hypothetical protein